MEASRVRSTLRFRAHVWHADYILENQKSLPKIRIKTENKESN
jgi:hypothetical protein